MNIFINVKYVSWPEPIYVYGLRQYKQYDFSFAKVALLSRFKIKL